MNLIKMLFVVVVTISCVPRMNSSSDLGKQDDAITQQSIDDSAVASKNIDLLFEEDFLQCIDVVKKDEILMALVTTSVAALNDLECFVNTKSIISLDEYLILLLADETSEIISKKNEVEQNLSNIIYSEDNMSAKQVMQNIILNVIKDIVYKNNQSNSVIQNVSDAQ